MRAWVSVAAAAALLATTAEARTNSTGAIGTFLISNCAECTKDGDSIFCTEGKGGDAANFVSVFNNSLNPPAAVRVDLVKKKQDLGASDGGKYCWAGTFGKLLSPSIDNTDILESLNVTARLACDNRNLYYRQCVLSAETTAIFLAFGILGFLCATTCCCFWCGCCKCLNNKGDESKWGMCNRFCPWMPCSDPPDVVKETPNWMDRPQSEEENKSSLFGRNPMLSAQQSARIRDSTEAKTAPVGGGAGLPPPAPVSASPMLSGSGIPPPTAVTKKARDPTEDAAPAPAKPESSAVSTSSDDPEPAVASSSAMEEGTALIAAGGDDKE